MKRKILLVSTLIICLSILGIGTAAYFTSDVTAHNFITTGTVTIALVEQQQLPGEDGEPVLAPFPTDGITGVMPGQSVSKIVQVENTGSAPAYVRIRAEVTIISADGEPLPADPATFTVQAGWIPGTDEAGRPDGYYYYSEALPGGALTDAFITSVDISPAMGNEYQGCTVNVLVSAQAVQTANNGASPLEAAGWPEA